MPISDRTIEERARARDRLRRLRDAPLTLSRPVYFVPGWRDEHGACWMRMRQWLPLVLTNDATHVVYHEFFGPDGGRLPPWEDFLDFGDELARRIEQDVGSSGSEVDLVCHSMGGLDAVCAIALLDRHHELGTPALTCVNRVITYDTPFLGFAAAGNALLKKFVDSGRKDPWVLIQLAAMEQDSKRIAEVRLGCDDFLRRIGGFWPRGADNYDGLLEVTHESASFGEPEDFAADVRSRYHEYVSWPDTTHSGTNGVTNDVRAVVETLEILTAP